MSPTIQDIADHAGVSSSTVSRVLSVKHRSLISKASSDRVMKAVRELRYRPNYAARALATGRTNMVAFWSPDFRAPFANKVAHQMHRLLKDHGYETIMSELSALKDKPFGDAGLAQWKVDGIIINSGGSWLNTYPQASASRETPIIRISTEDDAATDLVLIDLLTPSLQAVRSLVDQGRQRIAHMLTGSTEYPSGRYKAYLDAMAEASRRPELIRITLGTRPESREAVKEHVKEHGCPDAIFCANDEIAIGAYRGLRDMGIRIPDDVALVGCDGIEETEYLDTPISTIVQPVQRMCEEAWRLLHDRLERPEEPLQKVRLEAVWTRRDSSEMGAFGNPQSNTKGGGGTK
ncbi:MAG: LacI family DNA-binding transcriptional regulator [Phycisphaerales bacterium]|nr:LacI family DNA-binding transcriptional regulator [Phycisphaerales bacterium]